MAAAAVDPWSAAFGALGQAATAAPAGPSQAGGGSLGGSSFDSSGWNVTFGNNSGVSTERTQANPVGQGIAALTGNPMLMVALAVGAVIVFKKMRSR